MAKSINSKGENYAARDILDLLAKQQAYTPLGRREDGSPKGMGYYGMMPRSGGGVSTELTIGVEQDGRERLIPSMVPGLSWPQMDFLLNKLRAGDKMPRPIVNKAIEHSQQRGRQGLSPFFD